MRRNVGPSRHAKFYAGLIPESFAEAGLETRYYTPEVHKAAFVLPAFIRDLVEAG